MLALRYRRRPCGAPILAHGPLFVEHGVLGLRGRTLILIAATLTLLTSVLLSIVSAQTRREFGEFEKAGAAQDAERARDSLREFIAQMDNKLSDWSGWDDACSYAQGMNETFESANLLPEALRRLQLSAIMIYDNEGLVRWAGMLDESGEYFVIPPEALIALGKPGAILGTHTTEESSTNGVIEVNGRHLLVASRPIITSEGKGPIRGSMLWARGLDQPVVDRLSAVCHSKVEIVPVEAAAGGYSESISEDLAVRVLNDSTIESFASLEDLRGVPMALLKVTQPREVSARAGAVVRRFGFVIVTSAALFGVLIYVLLTAFVTSRIATLALDVRRVATSRDGSKRVEATGSDEIAALAGEVNSMLASLASTQAQLSAACAAAESANTAKSRFLANMSHEIRTPMTAILGFADLLADTAMAPAERADHVMTIRRNGEHLLGIINDILDISKIEAGKMGVEMMRVDLLALLEDVRGLMAVRASNKGLALRIEAEWPLPAFIRSDALRLRQVLVNLVGNAIKFTETGSVTIRVALAPEDCRTLELAVVDTGIGLTPEQASRIFTAFSQADASTTRRFGGTGLGLSISKALVEMLGGKLSVAGVPGQGSVFTATIDIGETGGSESEMLSEWPTPSAPEVAKSDTKNTGTKVLAGVRVLLAEDGHDNQRLIRFILNKAGATVEITPNGRVAVDRVLAEPTSFDLILMDMQMPVLDGCSATRELRAAGCELPILALTANVMSSDREECEKAGCSGFMSKPIAPDRLIDGCGRAVAAAKRTAGTGAGL